MVRRLIGVGLGLGFLILLVLAFRGCLEARQDRGISNYTSDVSTIMTESEQRGRDFFDLLDSPGTTSQQGYETQVNGLRGACESLLDRAEALDAPGEMKDGNDAIVQTLRLRRDAMTEISDNIGAALAPAEQEDPIAKIADQMKKLYASDVLYSQVAVPDIEAVIQERGITGAADLSSGNFMPEGTAQEWLDPTKVIEALGGVSAGSDVAGGSHGLGLISTTLGGVTLDPAIPVIVPSDSNEIEVAVQNQGDTDESDIEVTVTVGGEPSTEAIPSIAAGGTETANIALQTLPSPGTETTIDVEVSPVPGEEDSANNSSSYTVTFSD